jgi:hypothetical protein
MKQSEMLFYGAAAVAAYLLWKKFSVQIGEAVSTATAPLANAYVSLTSPPLSIPQGSVILPDLRNFPAANLTSLGFGFKPGAQAPTFTYNGTQYYLAPHDENGNYQATPV